MSLVLVGLHSAVSSWQQQWLTHHHYTIMVIRKYNSSINIIIIIGVVVATDRGGSCYIPPCLDKNLCFFITKIKKNETSKKPLSVATVCFRSPGAKSPHYTTVKNTILYYSKLRCRSGTSVYIDWIVDNGDQY